MMVVFELYNTGNTSAAFGLVANSCQPTIHYISVNYGDHMTELKVVAQEPGHTFCQLRYSDSYTDSGISNLIGTVYKLNSD